MQDLNANFMSLRRSDFDIFNFEFFSGGPTDGGFAVDDLSCCLRHVAWAVCSWFEI